MKEVPDSEGLTPEEAQKAWEALVNQLPTLARAQERGESAWMRDIRRAQARLAAARAIEAERRSQDSEGES
jgi:hypothetical protein